jgi:predicted dehydrogenase
VPAACLHLQQHLLQVRVLGPLHHGGAEPLVAVAQRLALQRPQPPRQRLPSPGPPALRGATPEPPGPPARGPVTVDDAALFIARFAGGALGSFEATRFATGHDEGLRVEVNGELGSVIWELGALNELRLFDATDEPVTQGFRRIQVTRASHPYAGAWWPEGHTIGYEHTFTHEVRDLLEAIAAGRDPVPSFADGLAVQQVLDAVARSAAAGSTWTEVAA